jgi:hypothetical protein
MRLFWRDDSRAKWEVAHQQADELRARNVELHAANGQLRETVEALRQQVAELQGRIIEDNHRIIDHFAMRATNSPVFANPPEQAAPVRQPDPRPRLEDITERETRKFYQNHRIAGLGLPLTPQAAPADMAHDET